MENNIIITDRDKQRFFDKIINPNDWGINNVCCLWTGSKSFEGYGQIGFKINDKWKIVLI